MTMTQRFDNYEIHPVIALDKDNQPTKDLKVAVTYEQCTESDPYLIAWSVFGHLPKGGVECIADCELRADAELVYNGLMERLARPALLDAALLAQNVLKACQPPINIRETICKSVNVERAIRAIDRAVAGATITESHILIPVEKATVRRLLPNVDDDQLGDVMENFRERLQAGLLEEYLPDAAREVCGAGMRA